MRGKKIIIVVVSVLATLFFYQSVVSVCFAFPPFTESEKSKANKNKNNIQNSEGSLSSSSEIYSGFNQFLQTGKDALQESDLDLSDEIKVKWNEFLASDYYYKASETFSDIINKFKLLCRDSQTEIKPVTKYVSKEWKEVKKELNIKPQNGGTKSIRSSFDAQIKETKDQLHNFTIDSE